MPSKLSTAPSIIARGVFDALSSFEELEQRVSRLGDENTKVLGDAFEVFVEAFLATQPKFMAEEVWLVGQVPLVVRQEMNLPNDSKGIDGIFRTRTGALVPYQVKFRSKRAYLTYTEVAPFLGLTERAKDRIIFTNSNEIAVDAKNRDAMRSVRGGDFDDLTPDDFRAIECWLKEKPFELPKPQPRDYQIEALDAILGTLETHDRATAVMACGTGKTLLALWVTERLQPKSVLVLVPSLTLLQQTLDEWSRNNFWGRSFSYLCVCSDPSVAQGNSNDSIEIRAMDVEFSVDTDPAQVRKFLERDTHHVKVVFSTYQSSNVVIEGAHGLPAFDFAIFDEAHKTTGPKGGLFSLCLSDENLKISKRLFLTATPRHFDIRHRDKEGDFKVVSMDDEKVYGPRAYTLTFGAAAKRRIICNYKVVISLVDVQEISQFALEHGITIVDGDLIGAKWVANQIAVERAIKKTGSVRAITFHSRVSSAAAFSSNTPRGVKQFLPDFSTFHVSGSQKSSERKQLIKAFRDAPKAIITNARCLTEGIDIPAVDMVAFIDPRQSRVDIAQATGRAMRKARGSDKTTGYVVIPLFVDREDTKSLEESFANSDFSEVCSVLNAMQEQDDDLVQIIGEMKESKGRSGVFNPEPLKEKIEVLGPSLDLSVLKQNIYAAIVDSLGSSWEEWYGRLLRFRDREGHIRVAPGFVDNGLKLGIWVREQRKNRFQMPATRQSRLQKIGFEWDPQDSDWAVGFAHLKCFWSREGHFRIPRNFLESGYNLGNWVGNQRALRDSMSPIRKKQLDEIRFVWNTIDDSWEEGFSKFASYKFSEGHCRVPSKCIFDNYNLGSWVTNQRSVRSTMSAERKDRLDNLGFIWDPQEDTWNVGFDKLNSYFLREGHCQVPRSHREDDYKLGQWVTLQRQNKENLSEVRIRKLANLDFFSQIDAWDEGYLHLKTYRDREGNCRVPPKFVDGNFKLGSWVHRNRLKQQALSHERRTKLNSLGFEWDPYESDWDIGFSYLEKFRMREGHCRVRNNHKEEGFRLGQWVGVQRQSRNTMSIHRSEKLERIDFIWNTLDKSWEIGFSKLSDFRAREGHCRVPEKHIEGAYALGKWVGKQRQKKDVLKEERRQRLCDLGFIWSGR